MKRIVLFSIALFLSAFAFAKVNVVTSYTEIADIARQVGGNRVDVVSIARGVDNPHQIDPRPSQVVKLARADLFCRIGMDLDLWADALLNAARNGKVMPNGSGYVDCSKGVRRMEIPSGRIDPSHGDIHIYGNPHFAIDPVNGKIIAANIAEGLKRVDPAGASIYTANLNEIENKVDALLKGWKAMLAPYKGASVVTYHKTWIYFLNRFGLKEFGNVEDRPGIPPTPTHISNLIRAMKNANVKLIITEPFRPRGFVDQIARQTGARVVVLPISVGGAPGANDYLSLIDIAVRGVAGGLK
jgi:zinc/manganese transport system substrate-binding protein